MTEAARQSLRVSAAALWIVGILVAAIVPYVPSLSGEFVLDDTALIVSDLRAHSLSNLPGTFFSGFVPSVLGTEVAYYRPVVVASYQANYMMAGPHPFVFRLTNVLLHALVALLVFVFARRLTQSLTAAGVAAVAFGCLPAHAEAVAWISGRTDVIAALLVVAAMIVFAAARARPAFSWGLAIAVGLLWFLALLSKESSFVLPVLMAGYAWVFPSPPKPREAAKWIAVIAIPFVICLVLRHQALHASVVFNIGFMLGRRILGVGIAYVSYLGMMFAPRVGQVAYDVFPIGMKYPLIALAAWLVPVGMVVASVRLRKSLPVVSYGLLWVFASLLPVSNILPASSQVPSERFVYLASVGSSMILGWLAWRMLEWRPRGIRAWSILAAAIVCWFVLYCSALTVESAQPYHTNLAWAREVTRENKRFFRAWAGYFYAEAGLLREAVREFEAATVFEKHPEYSRTELGRLLCALGEPEKAIGVLTRGSQRFPRNAQMRFWLGVAYVGVKDMASAAAAFRRATELDPKFASAWRNLGKASLKLRRYPEAVAAYKRAFGLVKPTDADRRDYESARRAVRTGP